MYFLIVYICKIGATIRNSVLALRQFRGKLRKLWKAKKIWLPFGHPCNSDDTFLPLFNIILYANSVFSQPTNFILGFKKQIMADTKAKKVLIVEDEGDMCLLINILLSRKGIELDHVQTLAAAETYLQASQPNVVILDNRLPDGLGLDFIPVLKKTYPGLKIIMISGFDKAAEDVALEIGADIYLAKPFTKEQLFAAVEQLV
ncbi:MAG: response regulator [Sphingobacteriales bacterium]|nr:MAG: response regulator [Sphingobacteriales bacterium]